jgi:hypothetical protein
MQFPPITIYPATLLPEKTYIQEQNLRKTSFVVVRWALSPKPCFMLVVLTTLLLLIKLLHRTLFSSSSRITRAGLALDFTHDPGLQPVLELFWMNNTTLWYPSSPGQQIKYKTMSTRKCIENSQIEVTLKIKEHPSNQPLVTTLQSTVLKCKNSPSTFNHTTKVNI